MQFVIDYITELVSYRKQTVFEVTDEQTVGTEVTITQLNGEYHCSCGNDDAIHCDHEAGIHCTSCGGRYERK